MFSIDLLDVRQLIFLRIHRWRLYYISINLHNGCEPVLYMFLQKILKSQVDVLHILLDLWEFVINLFFLYDPFKLGLQYDAIILVLAVPLAVDRHLGLDFQDLSLCLVVFLVVRVGLLPRRDWIRIFQSDLLVSLRFELQPLEVDFDLLRKAVVQLPQLRLLDQTLVLSH